MQKYKIIIIRTTIDSQTDMNDNGNSNAEMIKQYRRYLKLGRNYSENTLKAYMDDLQKLLNYANCEGLALTEVKLDDLRNFAAAIIDIGISPRSQGRILSGVRAFYKFLLIDGYIQEDPTELLEWPKIGEHLPEVLSVKEIDMMEAAVDMEKWEGQRNKAIIEVLFCCGLRVSELTDLKMSDLFLDEKFIRVIGKGDKERLVPISESAIQELRFWFVDRNVMKIKPGEEDYVFLNIHGKHLTRAMIFTIVKRLAASRQCFLYEFLGSLEFCRHADNLSVFAFVATVSVVVYIFRAHHHVGDVHFHVGATSHAGRNHEVGSVAVNHLHRSDSTVHLSYAAFL